MSRNVTLPASAEDRGAGVDPSPPRTGLRECRPVNEAAAAVAARELLTALGADLDSEGLRETPRRMAAAYRELLTRKPFNLTTQIVSWLHRQLQPKGVGVVLEAEDLCMSLRGVKKTVTSALHGLVRDDPRTRESS